MTDTERLDWLARTIGDQVTLVMLEAGPDGGAQLQYADDCAQCTDAIRAPSLRELIDKAAGLPKPW